MATTRGNTLRAVTLMVAVAILPATVRGNDDEAVRKAAERDMQALGWLFKQGLRAVPVPAVAADKAPDEAQQERIKQQARQMERFFQPMLHAELELVRRTCGSLTPGNRRTILELGREAVRSAAGGLAERQLTGRLGRDPFDPRAEIRRSLGEIVAGQAPPAEAAAYAEAVARRDGRRAAAARAVIVSRVDRQIGLSAAQRRSIESELDVRWDPAWVTELEPRGVRINNYPPAPDRVAVAILPHLDPEQLAEWERWSQAAGSRMVPQHFNLNLDGQGIQQLDGWWGR
jgi:hypothetical protein